MMLSCAHLLNSSHDLHRSPIAQHMECQADMRTTSKFQINSCYSGAQRLLMCWLKEEWAGLLAYIDSLL